MSKSLRTSRHFSLSLAWAFGRAMKLSVLVLWPWCTEVPHTSVVFLSLGGLSTRLQCYFGCLRLLVLLFGQLVLLIDRSSSCHKKLASRVQRVARAGGGKLGMDFNKIIWMLYSYLVVGFAILSCLDLASLFEFILLLVFVGWKECCRCWPSIGGSLKLGPF